MTAKLANVNDRILARVEEAGAIPGGSIIPLSCNDKPQAVGIQFNCG
jgi:hypothetical protein